MKLLTNKQRHRLIDLIKRDLCEATVMATKLYVSGGLSTWTYKKYIDNIVVSAMEEAHIAYGRKGVLAIDNETTKCMNLMYKAVYKVGTLRPGERCIVVLDWELMVVKTTASSK